MKIIGLFLTLALFFAAGYGLWLTQENQKSKVPKSYQVMDDLEKTSVFGRGIEFHGLDGKKVEVDQFKDKIVIFSFWATWCAPCVDEFPSFIKLLDAFPEKVVLLAISHDQKKSDVKNFIDAFQGWRKNMFVVFDEGSEVSKSLGVGLLPEGYVFDKKGKLVKKILGIQDWASAPAMEYFRTL